MGEVENKWAAIWGSEEWSWVKRLGAAITDPEEKKAFWETVKARKEADPHYSVFTDFPRSSGEMSKERRDRLKAMEECMNHLRSIWRPKKEENAG